MDVHEGIATQRRHVSQDEAFRVDLMGCRILYIQLDDERDGHLYCTASTCIRKTDIESVL